MRMEESERMLFRRAVVAQHEVELVEAAAAARNRRDRVVRRAIRLCENLGARVAVLAPCAENLLSEVSQLFAVLALQADRRHRPFDTADLDVLKTREGVRLLDRRLGHREGVAAALVVVVREDGSADDRQICIRAEEIVREDRHEVQEILEALARDLHWHVLAIQDNAMFIIIRVRGILQEPTVCGEAQRDQAVRLARRMARMAGIAFVLAAEQAFRVARRRRELCLGDVTRVLLRLREVDRDVEVTVLRRRLPDDVLVDAVLADVVRRDAHLVELIRRGLRAARVVAAEAAHNLRRSRHHAVHDARVEEIAVFRRILDESLLGSIVEHILENRHRCRQFLVDELRLERVYLEDVEQAVGCIVVVILIDQHVLLGKIQQAVDFRIDGHDFPSFRIFSALTFRLSAPEEPLSYFS